MADILIKNGFIATMDRKKTVYRRGSMYVKNDRIVAVGEAVNAPDNPAYIIDAEDRVVLPVLPGCL
jgi:cytosine/adenosine deaminase-related metal-dependent hydrolase